MAAIRHILQKDVFTPADERLVGVVSVTKHGQKKKQGKTVFLCATVGNEKPYYAAIHKLKKTSDKENYKRKVTWSLRDLTLVDGRDADSDTTEFDLHFDKSYRWVASSLADKNAFINCLWKLCHRYFRRRIPHFTNVDSDKLEENILPSEEAPSKDTSVEEYQELTKHEEADLQRIMASCDWAIGNAEAFTERLAEELSGLDGANIHAIMGSEHQVQELIKLLDQALWELENTEMKLQDYDSLLQTVRESMEVMEEKDRSIRIEDTNRERLAKEIETLMDQLELSSEQIALLDHGELHGRHSLSQCVEAAHKLQAVQNVELSRGLSMMSAVTECREQSSQLCKTFSQRVRSHLTSLFSKLANETVEMASTRHSSEAILRPHSGIHHELMPYAQLVTWLRTANESIYTEVCKSYVQQMKKVYEMEVKQFMESAKQNLSKERRQAVPGAGLKQLHSATSTTSVGSGSSSGNLRSGSSTNLSTGGGSDDDRSRFDHVFNTVINQLDPVCSREEDFLGKFYGFDTEEPGGSSQAQDSTDGLLRKAPKPARGFESGGKTFTKKKMLMDLLAVVEPEVQQLVQHGDRIDGFNTLYMLARCGQDVLPPESGKEGKAGSSHSHLHQVLGSVLVTVKRLYDKFLSGLVKSCQDLRVDKKKKCGILPCVKLLEEFAAHGEGILANSDRRSDVDKSYKHLITAVEETIERIALDHAKTPPEVILFENYHHLVAIIARNKITVLESHRDRLRQKYKSEMMSYVTSLLGRPLEKLSIFFDGIEEQFATGVKPEEIGYRLKYNKTELKKCIKEYPGKEVQKGLSGLYKKLEKHLCEEENLLQVVWLTMQDEFIKQYNHFTNLIQRCYPDAMISIEFSLDDLLGYFSSIAQQH